MVTLAEHGLNEGPGLLATLIAVLYVDPGKHIHMCRITCSLNETTHLHAVC